MKTCWTITNGTAGTVSQSLGLAQAIGFKKIIQKVFKANFSLSLIPAIAHVFLKKFLASDSDKLKGPWPNVVIGCGRRVIPFLLYIKKASGGKTYCIYIQDPKISSKYFDLVIKMQHDSIEGNNVIATDFSLNLVSKEKLFEEKKKHMRVFARLTKPYYSILIGGNTKRFKMNNQAIKDLFCKISAIVELCPGSILITTSRRTPKIVKELLRSQFNKNSKVHIVESGSKSGNPYFAMLALAEKIFVTNDSVNMVSEACACEKPVYIIPLLNISLGKTKRFLDVLNNKDLVKTFDNNLVEKTAKLNFNNNELVADKMRKKMIEVGVCSLNDFNLKEKNCS